MTVILASWEAETGKITVQGQSGQIVLETSPPNNHSKMDWRCGSSSRVPALQVQKPKLRLQSHQRRRRRRRRNNSQSYPRPTGQERLRWHPKISD
jgi:hypothetical protein